MSETYHNLIVGFGSPHGDDQSGWLVADRLAADARVPNGVAIRKAAVPLDLLDHLEGVVCLHVCDAVHDAMSTGAIRRWEWNAESENSSLTRFFAEFTRMRCGGSHGFGLMEVLDLAAKLRRLPQRIVIWAVGGNRFAAGDAMTENIERALPKVADAILNELNHARAVPGAVSASSS